MIDQYDGDPPSLVSTFSRSHEYYLHNGKSFLEASEDCQNLYRGGNLATFQDEDEWNAVKAWLLSDITGWEIWLGYTDQDSEGYWHSVEDGSGMPGFMWPSAWMTDEPNNSGGDENCGMFKVGGDGVGDDVKGVDVNCGANYGYVCRRRGT